MRVVSAILVVLLMASSDRPPLVHRLIVQPTSKLTIDGTTNVNSFTCAISKYVGRDTLVLHEGGKHIRPVFVKGAVSLDASSFDCGMALMTSDFHKTINSTRYPAIVIDFISFERMPAYTTSEQFKGILKISLAGATRLFEVNCAIGATSAGLIQLSGSREFLFSDFGLTPPARILGAVKVQDALKVTFNLKLALDPNS